MSTWIANKGTIPAVTTNYDSLIRKTPEEMANWIEEIAPHKRFAWFLNWKTWLDWLKQEAADEK